MNNFIEVLLNPISKVWKLLESQSKAQASICMISRYMIDHLKHTNSLMERYSKDELHAKEGLTEHILLTLKLSNESFDLLHKNKEILIYPFLINAWAIVETTFDDLIIRLLINDTKATEKLSAWGITNSKNFTIGSEPWVGHMFKKIENKASSSATNRDFEYHKQCLSYFGINLEYQAEKIIVLKEINQVRNCILHNQGIVRQSDVNKCPKLAPHIGKKIPADDPIFLDCLTLISNYTVAWISAIMFSPYSNGAMLKDARNPFSIND